MIFCDGRLESVWEDDEIMSESKSFFPTLPGILSGLAALLTAVGGLLFALNQTGVLGTKSAQESPVKQSSVSQASLVARMMFHGLRSL